jgi:nicotinamidase-related amidase
MKALLIIDMQVGLFKEETPRFDATGVIARINQLSAILRSNGDQIIFIQHDGNKTDSLEPGTVDWQLLPDLHQGINDLYIRKTTCDSFFKTELDNVLKNESINEILVTGCATDFCVDTTIRSAASNTYKVVVVKDGHTTTDRPHINEKTVIAHHNWVWENLIVPDRNIDVIASEQLIKDYC